MAVTNFLQSPAGFNSYRLDAKEEVASSSFLVGDGVISISFAAYSTADLANDARLYVRFIGADGLRLSTYAYKYALQASGWKTVKYEAIQPPTGAKRAVIVFRALADETIYISQPKVESGAVATAFTSNYEGQLSRMTATGIYTGTLTAGQVILPNRTLSDELAVITSKQISFTKDLGRKGTEISKLSAASLSLETRTSAAEGSIATLTSSLASIETRTKRDETRLTEIEGGKITLSEKSSGKIAGMTIAPNILVFGKSGERYQYISATANNFIYCHDPDSDGLFQVSKTGVLTARGAKIYPTGGKIAGFEIDGISLKYRDETEHIYIAGAGQYVFYSHSSAPNGGYTYIARDGSISCHNLTASGNITANKLHLATGTLSGASGSVSGLTGTLSGAGGTFSGEANGMINSKTGYLGDVGYYGAILSGYAALSIRGGVAISGMLMMGGSSGIMTYNNVDSYFGHLHYTSLIKSSDERLKAKITRPIQNFPELIYSLPVKDFEYKAAPHRRQLGVIAQEINKELPRWATQRLIYLDDKGFFGVNYDNLHMASILAIQDINRRLERLEKEAG